MTAQETSLAFVERMESVEIPSHSILISREDFLHLRQIAKTAALIEEHRIDVSFAETGDGRPAGCILFPLVGGVFEAQDLSTAVRAVADKIKEQA